MTAGAVSPTVKIGARELSDDVARSLVSTIVDLRAHEPAMFELTFLDHDSEVASSGVEIGSEVTVSLPGLLEDTELIKGEVTAIEGDYENLQFLTIVRGYEKAHRLQRARRSRTFIDSTDGDIAQRIAESAGIPIDEIDDPGVVHPHIAQVAQTDWEFLLGRAEEIGYEAGVRGGKFFFTPVPGVEPSGGLGGAVAGAAAAAASALLGSEPTLNPSSNLVYFRPRVTAAGLTEEAEVRVWDPLEATVVVGRAPCASESATIGVEPADLAAAFSSAGLGLGTVTSAIPIPGVSLGENPSDSAVVVVDRPLAWGANTQSCVDRAALGAAERMASSFAEATGLADGDPNIMAGSYVTVEGVPGLFEGRWYVTQSTHIFSDSDGGYQVRFEVSGRQSRSLLGLTAGVASSRRNLLTGLVPGIVSDNMDPDNIARVKVILPWLSPDFVTDWARISQPGLGQEWGMLFIPEVGDEVLVGFEFGDARRPYVLGGLMNGGTELDLADPVKQAVLGTQVVKRGIISRVGHRVVFDDPTTPAEPSGITVGTADEKLQVKIDDTNKAITIVCDSPSPPSTITIEQKGAGGSLSLKAVGDITIESSLGAVNIKGTTGVSIN